ncbi:kunitz type trypsin inhibitor [Trifolium pratense]|uniref:Kunitz type trypsin inhibitor n=1 Tax=Trifolium pratense TaxID=57577 RepID=A0A2K3MGK0_TRIPR|nr:kunitz type trypsin inhibitor [Trifolium pratense]
MTTTRSLTIFILAHVCLFMMISTSIADQFVIDTHGESDEESDEYFIRPPKVLNCGPHHLMQPQYCGCGRQRNRIRPQLRCELRSHGMLNETATQRNFSATQQRFDRNGLQQFGFCTGFAAAIYFAATAMTATATPAVATASATATAN